MWYSLRYNHIREAQSACMQAGSEYGSRLRVSVRRHSSINLGAHFHLKRWWGGKECHVASGMYEIGLRTDTTWHGRSHLIFCSANAAKRRLEGVEWQVLLLTIHQANLMAWLPGEIVNVVDFVVVVVVDGEKETEIIIDIVYQFTTFLTSTEWS